MKPVAATGSRSAERKGWMDEVKMDGDEEGEKVPGRRMRDVVPPVERKVSPIEGSGREDPVVGSHDEGVHIEELSVCCKVSVGRRSMKYKKQAMRCGVL